MKKSFFYAVTFFSLICTVSLKSQIFFKDEGFDEYLEEVIINKQAFILSPLTKNPCNPKANYSLKKFNVNDAKERAYVSSYVIKNFYVHPEYRCLSEEIKSVYSQANSEDGLYSAMKERFTYAYILQANDKIIGFFMMRFYSITPPFSFLQPKRMHAFYELCNSRFFGIGKTFLNLAAVTALAGGVNTLLATATYPVKGYFEHLGWKGNLIYSDFKVGDKVVAVPQFKCTFTVDDGFKGF